ncbi:phosphoglucosamine mutase [Gallaecimonas xiamenensis]|uniref:Phosphoglucosamine mutase n=1 Tax=Gallaecimonas xiamenensis 3-C-1 TaxID=745411 RepID=K2IUM8_9GAMM|nr:phosphoglucosamine mutase [Gallaecimonas xiamenensis]EKE74031.1 phosphoglucosamine mutase [Gallaecimonas xiamenensis 3-C-1]
MSERKYFGTDGVRGLVGEDPITPEFALKLGYAAGKVLSRQGTNKILIGKDTRISGYMLESALEAGLSAAGINIELMGPMPTPAVAYLTRTFRAEAGIVISASHNPYHDNGIKFFSTDGSKLPDAVELAIEAELDKPMTGISSEHLGKARRLDDAAGRYIEFCKSNFPSNQSLKGLRMVVDCAHGATYHIAPAVFRELGAEVITIGCNPDGFNINAGFGATDTKALSAKVVEMRADFGIAFDGDGDRLMMVDGKGQLVDGDQLIFIIAKYWHQQGQLDGGVVGTLMSNFGMEVALKELGIPFERAKVGDRYVLESLRANGWMLGGESSGHIISLKHTTTGDGVVAALQVLQVLIASGRSLGELAGEMPKYPMKLINVRYQKGQDPVSAPQVTAAVNDAEAKLAGKGRVLLRKSGTEPVVRVMVEGADRGLVDSLAKEIAEVVTTAAQ